MWLKRSVFFICLATAVSSVNAQYYQDALRFSQSNSMYGGTARIQSIGGAQTALGGDISSAGSNPAGLGFFNRGTFVITPSLDFITSNTDYLGQTEETFKNNFNFANIGAAFHYGKGDYSNDKFKGGTLGISLSRSGSYHLDRNYEAANGTNSIIDAIAEGSEPGFTDIAFDHYLIDPIYEGENIVGYVPGIEGFPVQSESIEETGSQYQMNIAWGGNYDDFLYFGGGMGIQVMNYEQRRNYLETDFEYLEDDNVERDPLNYVSIYDEVDVRGAGVNFNFGAILRPVSFVLVGVSYTSPSFVSLSEESFSDFTTEWEANTLYTEEDEFGNVISETDIGGIYEDIGITNLAEYTLRTPSRIAAGATIFVGKGGFLTADVESVDYSNASLKSIDFSTSEDNDAIEELYTDVLNIRVGGEYRFDNFRLRAGYAVFPSPYKDANLEDQTNVTVGFGYRTADYFLDFAVVQSERRSDYIPYQISFDQPVASSSIQNTTVSVSFGINF